LTPLGENCYYQNEDTAKAHLHENDMAQPNGWFFRPKRKFNGESAKNKATLKEARI